MDRLLFALIVTSSLSFTAPRLEAQAEWRNTLLGPGERLNSALIYDTVRNRTVLFGGQSLVTLAQLADTWTLAGGTWVQLSVGAGPALSGGPVTVYDSNRDRIVAYGTESGGSNAPATWEFDGAQWLQRSVVSPPTMSTRSMAFDTARGVTVLFGGGQTWEWDGQTWTQRTSASSPGLRDDHRLAYHAGRQSVVLFGGRIGPLPTSQSDLWEWDGVDWTLLTTSGPTRHGHGLAYDSVRDRMVLFAGFNVLFPQSHTWEWDGVAWSLQSPATPPPARADFGMTFDSTRSRVVAFGGRDPLSGGTNFTDTWEWNGVDWTAGAASPPVPRVDSGLAYDRDRDRVVMYSGLAGQTTLDDTWELDSSGWSRAMPATQPPPNSGQPMAFDDSRDVTVMCINTPSPFDPATTWEYAGADWTLRGVAPDCNRGAMVYDSARGRVLLFGGEPPADTVLRAWDGQNWTALSAGTPPPARWDPGMAYDRRRDRVVLFGGRPNAFFAHGDTWEYDGVSWQQIPTAGVPPARFGAIMVYDETRDRTVLQGGRDAAMSYVDTWEWDGSTWTQVGGDIPNVADGHAATYDDDAKRVVAIIGSTVWDYATTSPASVDSIGDGCVGSAGTPALAAAPFVLPWLGDELTLDVTAIPANPSWSPYLMFGNESADIDLATLGAAGCTLQVNSYVSEALTNQSGSAAWSVVVPSVPQLAGQQFFAQIVSFDPPANALGVAVSNSVRIVPGIR